MGRRKSKLSCRLKRRNLRYLFEEWDNISTFADINSYYHLEILFVHLEIKIFCKMEIKMILMVIILATLTNCKSGSKNNHRKNKKIINVEKGKVVSTFDSLWTLHSDNSDSGFLKNKIKEELLLFLDDSTLKRHCIKKLLIMTSQEPSESDCPYNIDADFDIGNDSVVSYYSPICGTVVKNYSVKVKSNDRTIDIAMQGIRKQQLVKMSFVSTSFFILKADSAFLTSQSPFNK